MTDEVMRHQPDSAETDAAGEQWREHWRRGPTRTRWTELPPQVGDVAPSVDLVDAHSRRATPLSSMWAERPALLLFWRHFGCSCGRDRSARLRAEYMGYVAAGARVVIVGQGEPDRAVTYARANGIPEEVHLLCDPDESAYRAYGLLEAGPAEMLFDAPDEFLRCEPQAGEKLFELRGASGMPMVDNPWLLPGEFVVGRDGNLWGAYRFQFCEHWIDPRVNVAAIRFATGELKPAYG
jgi:peroxiredoxin